MFNLSPEKVLVMLVVALVVLGPDRLPHMARQAGKLWSDFRNFRQRLESDVRGNFPDLPSVDTISQAVRSPLSFLDSLADSHAQSQQVPASMEHDITVAEDPSDDEVPSAPLPVTSDVPVPVPGPVGTSSSGPAPAPGVTHVIREGAELGDVHGYN